MEGKYQPKDVLTAVDSGEIDLRPHRFGVAELRELIVVFSVLIMQFKIWVVFVLFYQFQFTRIQLFLGFDVCWAEVVTTFVDSNFRGAFPAKEG